jgi:acyl-CoA synthetase (AMP-forming)/AMP-acid ligase II
MTDPFSLLPLALAGHGGRVDDFEVQQLVAAGLTLLQRSAALVRALTGKRSAVLLPACPQFFVALAASEGRAALLIDPRAEPYEIAHQLADARAGAVFTMSGFADRLPADVTRVLLDDAPRLARVISDAAARDVDLGSHMGLSLEGDPDAGGSADEAVIIYTSDGDAPPAAAAITHASLLANARAMMIAGGISRADRILAIVPFSELFGLTAAATAPLLAGASIFTMPRFDPARAAELITGGGITELVAAPSVFPQLLEQLARRGSPGGSALRTCICAGALQDQSLEARWFEFTGVVLRHGVI